MLTLAIGEIIFLLAESAAGRHRRLERPVRHPAARDRARQRRAVPAGAAATGSCSPSSAIGFGVLWAVARSPFGLALRGIHANEERMRALGYSPRLYKFARVLPRGRRRRARRRAARGASAGRHARRRRVRHRGRRARVGDHRRRGDAVGPVPRRRGRRARARRDRPFARRTRPAAARRSCSSRAVYLLPGGIAGALARLRGRPA